MDKRGFKNHPDLSTLMSALKFMVIDINPYSLYSHLNNLEEQEFVERRNRELTNAQLALRGGYAQSEYRLTSKGIRQRHKYGTKGKLAGLEEGLVPAR